jgi:DNA-binding winged helix-turn-helix (wHTH) protein/lipoprotein NlpI
MSNTAQSYRFADVVVDCARFAVLKNGQAIKITPRAFEVLLYLIRQRGRVVGKQELFEQVWKETYVSDNALTRMIKEIRHVIGDDANAPRYIETLPKRGYRFVEEVQEAADERAPTRTQRSNGDSPGSRSTANGAAYQAYLKGRYFWNKRTEYEIKKAVEYFKQAIELDPNFALAWVGLAESYVLYSVYCLTPPREAYAEAKAAVLKALELDEQLAEARATLGLIKYEYDWDWAEAERELLRALELKPHDATAHHWYAGLLIAQGRFTEGLQAIRRAQELNPLSLIIHAMAGWFYYYARQYDLALQEVTKALEIDHNFGVGYVLLALIHERLGWTGAALEAARTGRKLLEESSLSLWALIQVLNSANRRAEAQELLGKLEELAEQQYVSPYERALIYLSQGDHELAFAWLEEALAQHDPWLIWLKVEPRLDPLRADPRFAQLLARVGHSPT